MRQVTTKTKNYWPWVSLAVVVVALVGFGTLVFRSAATTPPPGGTIKIVTAENFWGNIAGQIGGKHVQVTSIISDPNADPHLYESDARDAAAISSANLVVTNGLGYDDFMDKLLAASPNGSRSVISAATIVHLAGTNPNPHLWYDVSKVKMVAAAMEQQMAVLAPADRFDFERNLSRFDASLQPILDTTTVIKRKYPNAPVAYTERVPGYLVASAGLSVRTPAGFAAAIEDGDDPSPADTEAMDSLITNHGIKVLLYNAQTTSAVTQHVKDLANQDHIPVVGVTETLPADEPDFQSWQLDQAKALLAALGG